MACILYITGGSGGAGPVTSVEAYDYVTDTWARKTAMPTGRNRPTGE